MNYLEELIESAKSVTTSLERITQRWKADANQYQNQVREARAKNLPHDQMLSMMVALKTCAKEVEAEWIKLAVAYNKPTVMEKVKEALTANTTCNPRGTRISMTTPIEISDEARNAESWLFYSTAGIPDEFHQHNKTTIQLAINTALAEKDQRIAELENRITKEIRSHAATIKVRDEESDELRAQLTNARAAIVEKDKALIKLRDSTSGD